MKEKTKRKLRTFVCLLMIPIFLTGCRIKTTPLGIFAQILEYASASGSRPHFTTVNFGSIPHSLAFD